MVTHAINKFRRYQKGLTINDLFPQKEQGICSCGCGRKLEGRKGSGTTENAPLRLYFVFV